jgi:Na+/H+ antiporter NhaC
MSETPDLVMMILVLSILGAIVIIANILWYILKKRATGKWKDRVAKLEKFEEKTERVSQAFWKYIAIIIIIIIVVVVIVGIGYFILTWDI